MAVTICPGPNHLTLSRWPIYVNSIRNLSGISVMPTRGPNSPHYWARLSETWARLCEAWARLSEAWARLCEA